MTKYGAARRWDRIAPVILFAAIGSTMVLLVESVVPVLGHRIPRDDVATDYRLGFLWAVVLWLSLFAWPVSAADKRALLWLWSVKMVVVLGAMLFYESHFEGNDAFEYFDIPRRVGFQWPGFRFGGGMWNVVSLSSLHHEFLPDAFHAMKVSFAMVGLVAIYVFYRAAVRFLGREDVRVLYLLAFFPSILFWSSILGKDPVILLGISLYVYGVVSLYTHRGGNLKRLGYALTAVAGVSLATLIRVWLGPILVAPLVVFVLAGVEKGVVKAAAVVVVAAAFGGVLAVTNETFEIENREDLVATTDSVAHASAAGSRYQGGSSLAVAKFENLRGIIAFAPVGAFTALFRPLPGEVRNPFGFLASLENLGLLALLLRAIKRAQWREVRQPLMLWATTVILVWSLVYGFGSMQNLGAAVRWKLQILPLFVGVLCYLGRRRHR